MKALCTMLLLAVMLTQGFSRVLVLLQFEANREYIATVLCINREKPQLECNGKCYLKKQLEKQEQADKDATEQNLKSQSQLTLYCNALFRLQPKPPVQQKTYTIIATSGHPRTATAAIFHPPQFTA